MKKIGTTKNGELIEKLAELEHSQWSEWTSYMLDNLNKENISRWKEQVKTDYNSLPEDQKWSDRRWAKKVLEIFNKK